MTSPYHERETVGDRWCRGFMTSPYHERENVGVGAL